MEAQNTYKKVFVELVKAGLWANVDANYNLNFNANLLETFGTSDQGRANKKVDWEKVYQLAAEQSVQGLVLQGIERHKNLDVNFNLDDNENINDKGGGSQLGLGSKLRLELPSQMLLLQWIGEVQLFEQQNKAMNEFVAKLIEKLRAADVYAILVKGQGIAQCYEKPLWRVCGDVDLLLSADNYEKAKAYLQPLAKSIDEEDKKRKHIGLVIDSWLVELHGTLHTRQLMRLNKVIDEVQYDVFYEGNVRSWMNGRTSVFLPSPDNDVFFVFAHIIQHYFGGGVGLRQICDWCRLLWTFRDSLNHELLESRLRKAGMMTEWRVFSALAVNYLRMPIEAMPLYSTDKRWKRKANKVLDFVMKSGNLGQNIDGSYRGKFPYLIWKAISTWRYMRNTATHLSIFPKDSIVVLARMVFTGIKDVFGCIRR